MTETELKPYRRGYYQYKSGEVLDVVVALPFAQGNVLKYIFRPGKGRYVEDLGKALFYLQLSRDTADSAVSRVLPQSPFRALEIAKKVSDFSDELGVRGYVPAAEAAKEAILAFSTRDKQSRVEAYAKAEKLIKQQIADLEAK